MNALGVVRQAAERVEFTANEIQSKDGFDIEAAALARLVLALLPIVHVKDGAIGKPAIDQCAAKEE